MHQVETLVDIAEGEPMRDEIVDIDLLLHIPIDDLRHVAAAARAAKGGALPDAAGDELKRPGLDLLPGAGDADDYRHAPAAMTAFQCLAHDIDIADAFEAVIGAAIGQRHKMRNEIGADLFRVDEMRHAEF